MNGTELNTLRRSLWLSRADAAVLFGVGERTLRHWESGDWAVPDDVLDMMRKLDDKLTAMADAEWDKYLLTQVSTGVIDWTKIEAVLIRYAAPEDMPDEFKAIPGAYFARMDLHAAGIDRARIMLEGEGARVRIVMFRPALYYAWIDEHAMPDNSASRAAWAASTPEAPPRANKTA